MKLVTLLLLFSLSAFAQDHCDRAQENADPKVDVAQEQSVANTLLEVELVNAIKNNDIEKLKVLLADGVDPNTIYKGKHGQKEKPVIFYALEYEHLEAFKLLLSYGANGNAVKTADAVVDNNLLMVAFRKHARKEGKGNLTKFIKIMLDGKYELEGKQYSVEIDPYARGGIDGYRDIVSVIHKNGSNAESLSLLYSHSSVVPTKFIHKRNYLVGSAIREEFDFLNIYLDFNSKRISKKHAQKALDYLKMKNDSKEHNTERLEVIQRLEAIAK